MATSVCQIIGGRYKIADPERDLLGRGGMGDVYRARDLQTGKLVAIKALRPEVVSADPNALARFRREGEALRQLNHPNIVPTVSGRRHPQPTGPRPGAGLPRGARCAGVCQALLGDQQSVETCRRWGGPV